MPIYGFRGNIAESLRSKTGRALSLWRDAGWGQLVASGKYGTECFPDELVAACVEMIGQWNPVLAPEWITCIPSNNNPELVPSFSGKLAEALNLPFIAISK